MHPSPKYSNEMMNFLETEGLCSQFSSFCTLNELSILRGVCKKLKDIVDEEVLTKFNPLVGENKAPTKLVICDNAIAPTSLKLTVGWTDVYTTKDKFVGYAARDETLSDEQNRRTEELIHARGWADAEDFLEEDSMEIAVDSVDFLSDDHSDLDSSNDFDADVSVDEEYDDDEVDEIVEEDVEDGEYERHWVDLSNDTHFQRRCGLQGGHDRHISDRSLGWGTEVKHIDGCSRAVAFETAKLIFKNVPGDHADKLQIKLLLCCLLQNAALVKFAFHKSHYRYEDSTWTEWDMMICDNGGNKYELHCSRSS